jgi:hypothetical protein
LFADQLRLAGFQAHPDVTDAKMMLSAERYQVFGIELQFWF